MAESSDTPTTVDLTAQENSNRFMALKEENATLHRENCTFQERFNAVEVTPEQPRNLRFRVLVLPMQPLFTPD